MTDYIDDLRAIVEAAGPQLLAIAPEDSAVRPAPGKWSPRELVGHLIDSASNNHQRFVRARFVDHLEFPGYDQDDWVIAQRYQEANWRACVELWSGFNLHLARVMEATPEAARTRLRRRHNLDAIGFVTVPSDQPATLDGFMRDYVDHLLHHLNGLLGWGASRMCAHLRGHDRSLAEAGWSEVSRGRAWGGAVGEWVYYDRPLEGLVDPGSLAEPLEWHRHAGTHDGREAGVVCRLCQCGVMGTLPDPPSGHRRSH